MGLAHHMMTFVEMLIFGGFGLLAGGLIGCVGVGGVILVPALVYLVGVPIKVAIAAAMFAFLLSGLVGTFVFARNKSIRWNLTRPLWLGAMSSALAGALTVSAAPTGLLEFIIAVLTAGSGVHALGRAAPTCDAGDVEVGTTYLFLAGSVTGFLSALTGTGGPLVLIPILMWAHLPVLTAIGLAQAIQLPIAALATAGNAYTGTLDVTLGLIIGFGIVFGTWGGAWLAHRLPREALRRVVAAVLAVVGGMILAKLGWGIVH